MKVIRLRLLPDSRRPIRFGASTRQAKVAEANSGWTPNQLCH